MARALPAAASRAIRSVRRPARRCRTDGRAVARREPEVVAGRDGPGQVGDRSTAGAAAGRSTAPVRGEPAGHGLRLERGDGDALTVDRVEGAQRVTDDEQPGRPAAARAPNRGVDWRSADGRATSLTGSRQPTRSVMAGSRSPSRKCSKPAGSLGGRSVAEPGRGDHPLSALHRQGESGGAVLGATEHHHPGPHREGAALLVETAGVADPRIDLVDAALRQLRQPSIEPRAASRGVHHDVGGHRGAPRRRRYRSARPRPPTRPYRHAGPSPWSRGGQSLPGPPGSASGSPHPSAAWLRTRSPSRADRWPASRTRRARAWSRCRTARRHGPAARPGTRAAGSRWRPCPGAAGCGPADPGGRRAGAAARSAAGPAPVRARSSHASPEPRR